MAQLHRFVKLKDRFDTQIFTFILPSSLIKEYTPDVFSKDFFYGFQRWCVSFVKSEQHVGAYLTLKGASDGMNCVVDFTFTMVNREHFTKNESVVERNCSFSLEKPTHGRRSFIGVSDLLNRGFIHSQGEFLVELELRSIRTTFEQMIQLPREGKEQAGPGVYRHRRFETNYFTFGNFDWNLSLYPYGDCPENDGRPLVFLTRQTSFDHLCKVRYRIILGHGDRVLESDTIEQLLDTSGCGDPYHVGYNLYNLTTSKAKLKLKVELLSVSAISEVQLVSLHRKKNKVHLYDRDKQAWMLESDVSTDYLFLRMYYSDVHNVPRKFTRYVGWIASVIPVRGHARPVKALGNPYSNYYSQTELDEGMDMHTDITVEELQNADCVFTEPDTSRITIHIEWTDSHLLLNACYHHLDEASSRHKHQMRREIMALQAENYALEKQLHSYQQSIAKTNARVHTANDMSSNNYLPPSPPNGQEYHSKRDKSY